MDLIKRLHPDVYRASSSSSSSKEEEDEIAQNEREVVKINLAYSNIEQLYKDGAIQQEGGDPCDDTFGSSADEVFVSPFNTLNVDPLDWKLLDDLCREGGEEVDVEEMLRRAGVVLRVNAVDYLTKEQKATLVEILEVTAFRPPPKIHQKKRKATSTVSSSSVASTTSSVFSPSSPTTFRKKRS